MQNSNSPPKYGAEGPPGGVDAWNAQRNAAAAQSQGKRGNLIQRMGGAIANMPQVAQARQAQQQAMSQPRPWGDVGRMQWGQQQGGAPQMPPQAQGAPPPMQGQMPGGATPSMPTQGQAASMPQQQPQRPVQQTGMAGLGQAAGKMTQMMQAAALRRRGGGMSQE